MNPHTTLNGHIVSFLSTGAGGGRPFQNFMNKMDKRDYDEIKDFFRVIDAEKGGRGQKRDEKWSKKSKKN